MRDLRGHLAAVLRNQPAWWPPFLVVDLLQVALPSRHQGREGLGRPRLP